MEPLTQAQARQYSPLALAFLGDSVYEILVREYLVREANRPAAKLHEQKIQLVCAAFQAQAIDRLIPLLTEEETAVYKRAETPTIPCHGTPLRRIIIRRPDWKHCSAICICWENRHAWKSCSLRFSSGIKK